MTNYNIKELAKEYSVSSSTIRMYLARAEFSHLRFERGMIRNFDDIDRAALEKLLKCRGICRVTKRIKRSKTAILKDKAEKQMNDTIKLRAIKPLSQEERDLLDYYKKQYEGAKGLLTSQGKTMLLALERIEQLEKRVEELEQCNI